MTRAVWWVCTRPLAHALASLVIDILCLRICNCLGTFKTQHLSQLHSAWLIHAKALVRVCVWWCIRGAGGGQRRRDIRGGVALIRTLYIFVCYSDNIHSNFISLNVLMGNCPCCPTTHNCTLIQITAYQVVDHNIFVTFGSHMGCTIVPISNSNTTY